jgi:hypothetical protein
MATPAGAFSAASSQRRRTRTASSSAASAASKAPSAQRPSGSTRVCPARRDLDSPAGQGNVRTALPCRRILGNRSSLDSSSGPVGRKGVRYLSPFALGHDGRRGIGSGRHGAAPLPHRAGTCRAFTADGRGRFRPPGARRCLRRVARSAPHPRMASTVTLFELPVAARVLSGR